MTDAGRYSLLQRFGLKRSDLEELMVARQVLIKQATAVIASTGADVVVMVDTLDRILSGRVLEDEND